jgi:hypothetical protein
MDYQTYLESIGCAPADVKRMVSSHAQHTFGEAVEDYNPASEVEVEDDAEAIAD